MSKAARLLGIFLFLRSKEWVSAKELSKRFKINLRTVYRDISELEGYGIPINSITGPDGGYSLDDHTMFNPFVLGDNEAFSLYLLGSGGFIKNEIHQHKYESVIQELIPDLRHDDIQLLSHAKHRIYFDTKDWYWQDSATPILSKIREAIFKENKINIVYTERNSPQIITTVMCPYGIVWKAGQWYVVGENNNIIIRIRLNRIKNTNTINEHFIYPKEFHLVNWWENEMAEFGKGNKKVKLLILPQAKDEFMNLSFKDNSEIEEIDDFTYVTLFVNNWDWLIPVILSYGFSVFVEEPKQLRNEIVKLLETTLAGYNNKSYKKELKVNNDFKKRASMR